MMNSTCSVRLQTTVLFVLGRQVLVGVSKYVQLFCLYMGIFALFSEVKYVSLTSTLLNSHVRESTCLSGSVKLEIGHLLVVLQAHFYLDSPCQEITINLHHSLRYAYHSCSSNTVAFFWVARGRNLRIGRLPYFERNFIIAATEIWMQLLSKLFVVHQSKSQDTRHCVTLHTFWPYF